MRSGDPTTTPRTDEETAVGAGDVAYSAAAPTSTRCESIVRFGDRQLKLAEFLAACAHSLATDDEPAPDPILGAARDALLAAGLPAVRAATTASSWIQVGLTVTFMHKPPGLRIRFETTGVRRPELARELSARTKHWHAAGLIAGTTPAVYEPEAHLFGGPASMASVHQRWHDEYFATPHAYVGPREPAAYYVVFHWNRGRLPILRQALLAESLARAGSAA